MELGGRRSVAVLKKGERDGAMQHTVTVQIFLRRGSAFAFGLRLLSGITLNGTIAALFPFFHVWNSLLYSS